MGNFSEKVRHGKVTGPRKRTFTLEQWQAAYEEFSSNDVADETLYVAGKHIHAKLTAIRAALSQSSLSRLSTETRVKAFVSAANHQLEALEFQMNSREEQILNSDGKQEIHIEDLATVQVKLADGVSYNVDAALGSILDGILIPTKVALMGDPKVADDDLNDVSWGDISLEMNLGSLYDQAENLWEDCVWNTYILGGRKDHMLAIPLDIEAKRGTHAAAARRVALGIESTSYAIHTLKQIKECGLTSRIKEVQAVINEGDKQHIKLGPDKLDPYGQSFLFALRVMACPPYYDSLLKEVQPKLAGATLSQLLDGWMVVSQAAKRLWQAMTAKHRSELLSDPNRLSDMREYIPYFTMDALVGAIHEATGISLTKARAIIEFLTFRGKNQQEFWTQPLVSTGAPGKLYPIFGAIATPPNLRFALERWMAQLKIKLDERGTPFENYLRVSLEEAVKNSPMLSQIAKVVPRDYTFNCSDESFGQIDALFCVGAEVFVVEAKCILEPTESSSIGTHRTAIERAVVQAKARMRLIEEHRQEFMKEMKRFGWNLPPEFRVNPLVAVSTIAHVGVPLDGVPVVDVFVLDKFFEGGYEHVGMDAGDFSVAERTYLPFYTNTTEAESGAAQYFLHPPQLKQYRDLLLLRNVPMYPASSTDWSGVMMDFEQAG